MKISWWGSLEKQLILGQEQIILRMNLQHVIVPKSKEVLKG